MYMYYVLVLCRPLYFVYTLYQYVCESVLLFLEIAELI